MSQLSYCNAHERASSLPTPVLDGCSSANFTFIATCTWTKLLRDETLLLDDRCPAVLPGVLGSPSMRSFSATRTPSMEHAADIDSFPGRPLLALSQLLQTSLVPGSQAGLADTQVRTHARTHGKSALENSRNSVPPDQKFRWTKITVTHPSSEEGRAYAALWVSVPLVTLGHILVFHFSLLEDINNRKLLIILTRSDLQAHGRVLSLVSRQLQCLCSRWLILVSVPFVTLAFIRVALGSTDSVPQKFSELQMRRFISTCRSDPVRAAFIQ